MAWDVAQLADELAAQLGGRGRYVLGIVGPPGSGKSTLAERLADALTGRGVLAAVLALDGFHLPNALLDEHGLRGVKGSPATFDAEAFVGAVEAVRHARSIRVPRYDRTLHEPVADAVPIPADTRLVIVEGNYLLLDTEPWARVAPLLDESWYLDVPIDECLRRVRARHIAGGRAPDDAEAHIARNDRPNAALIAGTRERAGRVLSGV